MFERENEQGAQWTETGERLAAMSQRMRRPCQGAGAERLACPATAITRLVWCRRQTHRHGTYSALHSDQHPHAALTLVSVDSSRTNCSALELGGVATWLHPRSQRSQDALVFAHDVDWLPHAGPVRPKLGAQLENKWPVLSHGNERRRTFHETPARTAGCRSRRRRGSPVRRGAAECYGQHSNTNDSVST